MANREVHQCSCPDCCVDGSSRIQEEHRRLNLLMSRLDEQERRWLAGVEAMRIGHGGDTSLSKITGLHVDTIRRGRGELQSDLRDRPLDRVRFPGGGRPPSRLSEPPLPHR